MPQPLMPKATAVWLLDNTVLTFQQIAEFCNLHLLEVKGIADGDVAKGIRGADPIAAGQLTRAEIESCQEDPEKRLTGIEKKENLPKAERRVGKKYTPLSKRQDRPDAIFWLVRNHPELLDAQISRLIGTTKNTIQSIRDRTHWNSAYLNPVDPVSIGLCTQIDLDKEVQKASKRVENRKKKELGGNPKLVSVKLPEECIVKPATQPVTLQSINNMTKGKIFFIALKWCPGEELNHRHSDFQSLARPTELPGPN